MICGNALKWALARGQIASAQTAHLSTTRDEPVSNYSLFRILANSVLTTLPSPHKLLSAPYKALPEGIYDHLALTPPSALPCGQLHTLAVSLRWPELMVDEDPSAG
jgi:hypothetical protein